MRRLRVPLRGDDEQALRIVLVFPALHLDRTIKLQLQNDADQGLVSREVFHLHFCLQLALDVAGRGMLAAMFCTSMTRPMPTRYSRSVGYPASGSAKTKSSGIGVISRRENSGLRRR